MIVLFEVIKIIFFLFTLFLATVLLKGHLFLGTKTVQLIYTFLFPAYLVFIGILFGYILALTYEDTNTSEETRSLLYTRMFIIGIALGALFALTYIFIL